MSANNTLAQKRIRRDERAERKALAAKRIPFHGVFIDSTETVLSHRYLAKHGLNFSPSAALVRIGSRAAKQAAMFGQ